MYKVVMATLFSFLVLTSNAVCAELRLMVTNGAKPIIAEVAPQFEKTTGHKLSISYEGSPVLEKAILAGDNFDVVLLIDSNMDSVAKDGRIDPATRTKFARSGLGVAVRAGQPKPDISTVDGFKAALVNAKSVAYVTAGASGKHFIAVCERLGIADQIRAKSKTVPTGSVAEFVVHGEAELAIQQMSEVLSVKGIDLVGPFPPELDLVSQISAAVAAKPREPEAAKSFIRFLSSQEVLRAVKAKGLQPG